jgi:chromosome segregation ATPase
MSIDSEDDSGHISNDDEDKLSSTGTMMSCSNDYCNNPKSLQQKIDQLISDIAKMTESLKIRKREREQIGGNMGEMELHVDALHGALVVLGNVTQCHINHAASTTPHEKRNKFHEVVQTQHTTMGTIEANGEIERDVNPFLMSDNSLQNKVLQLENTLKDEEFRRKGYEDHIIHMDQIQYNLERRKKSMQTTILMAFAAMDQDRAHIEQLEGKLNCLVQDIEKERDQVLELKQIVKARNLTISALMAKKDNELVKVCGVTEGEQTVFFKVRKVLAGRIQRKDLSKVALTIVRKLRGKL